MKEILNISGGCSPEEFGIKKPIHINEYQELIKTKPDYYLKSLLRVNLRNLLSVDEENQQVYPINIIKNMDIVFNMSVDEYTYLTTMYGRKNYKNQILRPDKIKTFLHMEDVENFEKISVYNLIYLISKTYFPKEDREWMAVKRKLIINLFLPMFSLCDKEEKDLWEKYHSDEAIWAITKTKCATLTNAFRAYVMAKLNTFEVPKDIEASLDKLTTFKVECIINWHLSEDIPFKNLLSEILGNGFGTENFNETNANLLLEPIVSFISLIPHLPVPVPNSEIFAYKCLEQVTQWKDEKVKEDSPTTSYLTDNNDNEDAAYDRSDDFNDIFNELEDVGELFEDCDSDDTDDTYDPYDDPLYLEFLDNQKKMMDHITLKDTNHAENNNTEE